MGEGIKSGGWSLTIDNSRGGGSVSYHSSLGDGTVPSGGSVELYLADGDPVWGIGATPDTGYIFGLWAVSATNVPIQNGYDQTSNPVAILVYSDGTIMANFVPVHVVPANPYGPLLAIAACFAGFFIFKRQRFGLGRTQHLKRTLTATLYRNFS